MSQSLRLEVGGIDCRLEDRLAPHDSEQISDFLESSPAASYLQSVWWPELAPASRLQHYRYLSCGHNGRLLVAGVVRFTRLFPGRYLATLRRGPIFCGIDDLDASLPAIAHALKRSGACTVIVNPRWEDSDAAAVHEVVKRNGFEELPADDQPMHVATGIVDLTATEEAIFAGFKPRCRRSIRAASRGGLIIRPADGPEDTGRFQELLNDFALRKKFDISALPTVANQCKLIERCGGVFLVAELQGRLIGGHIAVRDGNRAFWLVLASDDTVQEIPRGYNLIWEAMRRMKHQGCTMFDLAGVPGENRGDIGDQNRLQFKMAFNPRIVQLVRAHAKPLDRFSHTVLFAARQRYRQSDLKRYIAPLLRR